MKIDVAISAGALAAEIISTQNLLSQVDLVISENWPITVVRATAPLEGSSLPGGSIVDLLPSGVASPEAWKFAVSTARDQLNTTLQNLQVRLGSL